MTRLAKRHLSSLLKFALHVYDLVSARYHLKITVALYHASAPGYASVLATQFTASRFPLAEELGDLLLFVCQPHSGRLLAL